MPLVSSLELGPTFSGVEMTRPRKKFRAKARRPLVILLAFIIPVACLVYFVLAHNGTRVYSIFNVTQNVYHVDTNKNKIESTKNPITKDDYYSIIFDAGSTGTRIHIFHFRKNKDQNLVLLKDEFRQTKPGLSSYADEPTKAVQSVDNLLKVAKKVIPQSKWMSTPIVLKATAGLRLLPGKKSQIILDQVKQLFASSLFRKLGKNAVSIMDGDNEGIYGWLSVNYLSSKLESSKRDEMYSALDLGGGSVQITLPLPKQQGFQANRMPSGYVKSLEISRSSFSLYTHSYLGLGLMSARASILNESSSVILETGNNSNVVEITSPCFPVGYNDVWKFGGKQFNIKGTDECSFESCRDLVKKVIAMKHIDRPEQVKQAKIFAFSYFFDRATDLGLIDENFGGELLVQNYVDAAQTVCQRGSVMEKPFLCLDTSFIITLLTDGFGLSLHHQLHLKRKIEDFDVSWAVGAALDFYEQSRNPAR